MRYDYALFDLDGTLTESAPGILNSVRYALRKFGIEEKDDKKLKRFIGPPLVDGFSEICGFSHDDAVLATKYYREYYGDQGLFENILYEGVEDMLQRLRGVGVTLMVATSKPERFCNLILEHFGILEHFSFVAAALMSEQRAKKDEVIKYLLDSCRFEDRSRVVMVGDRCYDILGAAKFSLDSIGVTYGYGSEEELKTAGATYIAETTGDVVNIITEE